MAALEGYGPSEPLPAVNQHPLTAPTERTPSRGSAGNGHRVVATMIGGGLVVRSSEFGVWRSAF
jgi:hypothetical protein